MALVQYSTVHIYTQKLHRTAELNLEEYGPYAIFCELYPGIFLTTEEEAWNNHSQGTFRVLLGTMKTEIQNIIFIIIKMHKHNNKNT